MKKLWNSLVLAFAMYSSVPVPRADWEKENMRFVLCCFPLVGAVLGMLTYGWSIVCIYLPVGQLLRTAIYVLLPVLVTGGIHLDGFLDTCDALHSYAPRERKLEILKDPRAGAFAVICGISLFVLNFGLWSQLSMQGVRSLSMGFVISRCLAAGRWQFFPVRRTRGWRRPFRMRHTGMWWGLRAVWSCLWLLVLRFMLSLRGQRVCWRRHWLHCCGTILCLAGSSAVSPGIWRAGFCRCVNA